MTSVIIISLLDGKQYLSVVHSEAPEAAAIEAFGRAQEGGHNVHHVAATVFVAPAGRPATLMNYTPFKSQRLGAMPGTKNFRRTPCVSV